MKTRLGLARSALVLFSLLFLTGMRTCTTVPATLSVPLNRCG
jgi:hypothetical protein